jgi:hypothetical protein
MSTDKIEELSEEQAQAVLDGEDVEESGDAPGPHQASGDAPQWGELPKGLTLPRKGNTVAFLRIPARWTTDPGSGRDRVCLVWAIGETEERLAYQRSRGDAHRSVNELAKACIRAVDGVKARWDGKAPGTNGDIHEFWTNIGPKGRQMVRNYYMKTHSVTDEEALDFFSNHFVNVTVG